MASTRRSALRAIAISAVLAAGGCSGPASPTPSWTKPAVEIVVATDRGADLRYMPAGVGAPAGTMVRLTFRNVSTQAHNLTFEAPLSRATRTIVEAGSSDSIDFVTPAPGRYSFACTIHMGMTGTLTVE